jgi:uncharacterized protein YbjT (DUF2867 family)
MKRILVTGATGNIGLEVVHYLNALNSDCEITAAVRDVANAKRKFSDVINLQFRQFDFENPDTF